MTYCNLFHLDLDILSRGHEANLEAGKWGEKQITHGTFHILFGLQQMAYIHSEAVSKPELCQNCLLWGLKSIQEPEKGCKQTWWFKLNATFLTSYF